MDNVKNVQLHKIIKNSLATYLSYKWSENKLYLKKRKIKKGQGGDNENKKKKSTCIERTRSIINLENDVFIYDARTRTFTQLDLCDCFKNGLKYRKIDPFSSKRRKKKKYELCDFPINGPEGIQNYQSYNMVQKNDSIERIFSNQLMKKHDRWGKTMNKLCPSKFDLFIQKELNKCTGKNFNVKSFKINTKQETETPSRRKVCSSNEVGYYTITTFDKTLRCDDKTPMKLIQKKSKTKCCNGMKELSTYPKKLCNKGLQCKKSNSFTCSKKEELSSRNDTGIQCRAPVHYGEQSTRIDSLDHDLTEIFAYSRKKSAGYRKKLLKKHSSLSDFFPSYRNNPKRNNAMQINSSAEIRKIFDSQSTSSFNHSNAGEYLKTCAKPKTLLTYYQSTSKDNKGDWNHHEKNETAIVASSPQVASIYSAPCFTSKKCTSIDFSCPYGSEEKVYAARSKQCSPKCKNSCSKGTSCAKPKSCGKKDACCECSPKQLPANTCICDILSNLRERIKQQTEHQNRNLDQVLNQLSRQDKELKEIRDHVARGAKRRCKRNFLKRAPVCCCTALVQYDYVNNMKKTVSESSSIELNQDFEQLDYYVGDVEESSKPELIQIYGSDDRSDIKRIEINKFRTESLKSLCDEAIEFETYQISEIFKKESSNISIPIHEKRSCSSSNSSIVPSKETKNKNKGCKLWLKKLFSSKKDLNMNG